MIEQKNKWVRRLLIGLTVAFLGLFLVVPLVFVLVQAFSRGLGVYWEAVSDTFAVQALVLTLVTVFTAVAVNTIFGLFAAWSLTRYRFFGRKILNTFIDLPLSVSPVIAGLIFLLTFGRFSPIYPLLTAAGIRVVYAIPGIILATIFVTFPYVSREIIPVLEARGTEEEEAAALIDQVEAFAAAHKAEHGTSLVWCSDEFYLLAGRPLPQEDYYEEFTQLDNGVGMLRLLRQEFCRGLNLMEPEEMEGTTPFSIATGVSAAPFLTELIGLAREKCGKIEGTVYPIRNDFFGETITVAGLVTGGDLIAQLRGKPLGKRLLIPQNMLRHGERVFLDDVSLDDVEQELGVPVTPVAQDGYELLDAMCGLEVPPMEQVQLREETEYFQYNPGAR